MSGYGRQRKGKSFSTCAWKESRLITLAYFHLSTRGRVTSVSLLIAFFSFSVVLLFWNFTKNQVLVSSFLVTIWHNGTYILFEFLEQAWNPRHKTSHLHLQRKRLFIDVGKPGSTWGRRQPRRLHAKPSWTADHRSWRRKLTTKKLAQHTTPIAKTHGTAMLFASEHTENLKMLINVRHRNITNHDQNITAASPPSLRHQSITDTEQRHHQHKTKASSTYHQNITTQSLHLKPWLPGRAYKPINN